MVSGENPWLARHFHFKNDLARVIPNADARVLDRNVQSSKIVHAALRLLMLEAAHRRTSFHHQPEAQHQTPDRGPKAPIASNATTPAASPTPLFQRLRLGSHSVDVTSEQSGKTFAIVGAESFRKK